MDFSRNPFLVASWRDCDLVALRDWRRSNAQRSQDSGIGRDGRREALKNERAATLVLDCIEGRGKFRGGVSQGQFPAELHAQLLSATARLGVV